MTIVSAVLSPFSVRHLFGLLLLTIPPVQENCYSARLN